MISLIYTMLRPGGLLGVRSFSVSRQSAFWPSNSSRAGRDVTVLNPAFSYARIAPGLSMRGSGPFSDDRWTDRGICIFRQPLRRGGLARMRGSGDDHNHFLLPQGGRQTEILQLLNWIHSILVKTFLHNQCIFICFIYVPKVFICSNCFKTHFFI